MKHYQTGPDSCACGEIWVCKTAWPRIKKEKTMTATTPPKAKTKPKTKLRVMIIGGDERIFAIKWPEQIDVQAFRADDWNKAKTVLANGALDAVVPLTRFLPHSIFDACRRQKNIRCIIWPHGLGRLAKELPLQLGILPMVEPAPATPTKTGLPPEMIAYATWAEAILGIMETEPGYSWEAGELADRLGIDDAQWTGEVLGVVKQLIKEGRVEGRLVAHNRVAYMIPGDPSIAEVIEDGNAAPPPQQPKTQTKETPPVPKTAAKIVSAPSWMSEANPVLATGRAVGDAEYVISYSKKNALRETTWEACKRDDVRDRVSALKGGDNSADPDTVRVWKEARVKITVSVDID